VLFSSSDFPFALNLSIVPNHVSPTLITHIIYLQTMACPTADIEHVAVEQILFDLGKEGMGSLIVRFRCFNLGPEPDCSVFIVIETLEPDCSVYGLRVRLMQLSRLQPLKGVTFISAFHCTLHMLAVLHAMVSDSALHPCSDAEGQTRFPLKAAKGQAGCLHEYAYMNMH
jgi:hypothetical protein